MFQAVFSRILLSNLTSNAPLGCKPNFGSIRLRLSITGSYLLFTSDKIDDRNIDYSVIHVSKEKNQFLLRKTRLTFPHPFSDYDGTIGVQCYQGAGFYLRLSFIHNADYKLKYLSTIVSEIKPVAIECDLFSLQAWWPWKIQRVIMVSILLFIRTI